jgi:hypothetical protein
MVSQSATHSNWQNWVELRRNRGVPVSFDPGRGKGSHGSRSQTVAVTPTKNVAVHDRCEFDGEELNDGRRRRLRDDSAAAGMASNICFLRLARPTSELGAGQRDGGLSTLYVRIECGQPACGDNVRRGKI